MKKSKIKSITVQERQPGWIDLGFWPIICYQNLSSETTLVSYLVGIILQQLVFQAVFPGSSKLQHVSTQVGWQIV